MNRGRPQAFNSVVPLSLLLACTLTVTVHADSYSDDSGLDNAQWKARQASQLDNNANTNRYYWRNTLKKIAAGETFRMELDGTGLVGQGILNSAFWNLTNRFPVAGYLSGCYPHLYTANRSGGAYQGAGKDTNWFQTYEVLPAQNAAVQVLMTYPWNVLELDYIAHPGGGSFKVQTNNQTGGFADTGLTVNTKFRESVGRSVWFTNQQGAQPLSVRLMQTSSSGVCRIVNFGAWNKEVTRGMILGQQQNYSAFVWQELQVPAAIRAPIYAAWRPDLILWQDIEGTNAIFTTNLPVWLKFYKTNTPAADVVLCGTYPVQLDINNVPAANRLLASNAAVLGQSYFDGWSPFQDYTNVCLPRGFAVPNNVHYTAEGYATYGYFLYRWLALDSTFTGDMTEVGVSPPADRFGFKLTGSSNLVVVVESCTNLVGNIWAPVATNRLGTVTATNGMASFSDPVQANTRARFYRFRTP